MSTVVNRHGEMQEADFARFYKRVAIFTRKGMNQERAENFAYGLVMRDFERDDRRACIECAYFLADGTCFAAREGRLNDVFVKPFYPLPETLQRCHGFKWATK